MIRKLIYITAVMVLPFISCARNTPKGGLKAGEKITITDRVLADKIKGGWAGQTIGCTYGGPTEFRFLGTMIQDYVSIEWNDDYIKWWYDNIPGLYDDVYMDLTFVEVFDRLGLDAPADSFAVAFAKAGYPLWHANQAARYNILNGIMPPASGYWLNNPHADDIDYQIEADYSGLMSPGMSNTASEISDNIGHIMNYGDGWYGGVYVGAMYSLAFVSDDMEYIVTEALKVIPKESKYYRCMSDVITWYRKYPGDWKQTWFECQKKWSGDIGCPDGVFVPFNIDATINSAYILIGLLYGQGDFERTMEISTRCGQDSDCNPASAAGILGTMIGYDRIPEKYKRALHKVENMNFAYTRMSLDKTYKISYDLALKNIERNGGKIEDKGVTLIYQSPRAVKLEQSFEGLVPASITGLNRDLDGTAEIPFEGLGIVVKGSVQSPDFTYVAEVEACIDGQSVETVRLPQDIQVRRNEIFWNYRIPQGKHVLTLKWKNQRPDSKVRLWETVVYKSANN